MFLLAFLIYQQVAAAATLCADISDVLTRFYKHPLVAWAGPEIALRRPPSVFPTLGTEELLSVRPIMELPRGLSEYQARIFRRMIETLRSPGRIFLHILVLESRLKEESLENILSASESMFGFQVVDVRGRLTRQEWMKYLASGQTFNDFGGDLISLSINGHRTQKGHWRHARLAHRLQLGLILMDYMQTPEAYGTKAELLQAYKDLGDRALDARLDWSHTYLAPTDPEHAEYDDRHNLFFQIFDSAENNPSSPGFFHEYREFWPRLAEAIL